MESMRHARRATALLLATGLGLGLAGCGGSDPSTKAPASKSPSSSTPSPTPTETPTATPTPAQPPLSAFENRPPVKVLRKWAAATSRSINANDHSMKALAPFSTGDATRFESYSRQEFGLFYPGPLPFTPTRVTVTGNVAKIAICLQVSGWGQKKATKLPAEHRKILPGTATVKKVGGGWKVDGLVTNPGNCSNVSVKGVAR